MNDVFYWIGVTTSISGGIFLLMIVISKLIDFSGRVSKNLWTVIDYQRHKDEFKKWLDDNE